MYRYTTPTITLKISEIDFSEVALFRVAFEKDDYQLIKEITPSDTGVDSEARTIMIELTQEETAAMSVGVVSIQMRIKFNSGRVAATETVTRAIKDVIDEAVI